MFCDRPEEKILLDRWNDFALFVLSFLENLNFFWTKLNFNTFQNFNCLFLPSSFLSHCKIKFQYYSINLNLSFLDILYAMFNQFYYFPHSTKMQNYHRVIIELNFNTAVPWMHKFEYFQYFSIRVHSRFSCILPLVTQLLSIMSVFHAIFFFFF